MATDTKLAAAGAVELRDRLASGAIRAAELAEVLIARVAAVEPDVRAFAWFDPDHVRTQAEERDRLRRAGRPIGPLHGLPVALKDIIDTAGIPTCNGTVLDEGRKPWKDSAIVERLKAAGAVIMGKTVTAELAYLTPGRTRNPANPAHTPGGSSSGSAAAVAAGMVPLAVGTQTGGSVGVLALAVSVAALRAEPLLGWVAGDVAPAPAPHPQLLATAIAEPPLKPVFAFVRTPFWDRADADTHGAWAELVELLGEQCFEAELPAAFGDAGVLRERINLAEMAKAFHHYARRGAESLSPRLRAALADGDAIPARDYLAALDWPAVYNAALDEILDRCDAIITPAAPGPAPRSLETTGASIFNAIWTLCGLPAVTIPAFAAENGMPMGVQLVGRRGDDGRLLRSAHWLSRFLDTTTEAIP